MTNRVGQVWSRSLHTDPALINTVLVVDSAREFVGRPSHAVVVLWSYDERLVGQTLEWVEDRFTKDDFVVRMRQVL